MIYLNSNGKINTSSKVYQRIEKQLSVNNIKLVPFANDDILSWAGKSVEISRRFWDEDIPVIGNDNTFSFYAEDR